MMNSVFLSGYLDNPIQVTSTEDAPLHIKTSIKVSHFTAAGARKNELFPLSVWRETAKRFMEQARMGSGIVLEGYLSTSFSPDSATIEVTVTEFRITDKKPSIKTDNSFSSAPIADTKMETEKAFRCGALLNYANDLKSAWAVFLMIVRPLFFLNGKLMRQTSVSMKLHLKNCIMSAAISHWSI